MSPQKSNIDIKNCHFLRELSFPNRHFGALHVSVGRVNIQHSRAPKVGPKLIDPLMALLVDYTLPEWKKFREFLFGSVNGIFRDPQGHGIPLW